VRKRNAWGGEEYALVCSSGVPWPWLVAARGSAELCCLRRLREYFLVLVAKDDSSLCDTRSYRE
jgi:hypothetical protein